jgi:hypothetical protein
MPARVPLFQLYFERIFLESYAQLSPKERKAIDKALEYLAGNPRHPPLNIHKAKNAPAKYPIGGNEIFITYASMTLRITFEYGPEPGMFVIRNCGHHESSERKM